MKSFQHYPEGRELHYKMADFPHKLRVLVNAERKYSMLPSNLKIPAGWEDAGKCGSIDECLDYVRQLSGVTTASGHLNDGYDKKAFDEECSEKSDDRERPLVSIIMPTFNRVKLLPIAIKSILNQTYANWELLVVDDRSTDDTKALIDSYSSRDSRIRYMVNERCKGPSGARNFGIQHANGAYIAFLDSDDEWLEHHLSASLDVLMNENVKITLAANYKRINGKLITNQDDQMYEELEKALILLKPRVEGKLVFFGDDFFEYNVMERFNMYHINTIVLEKEVLDKVGLFNETLPVNEDYDLLFRIFHEYQFCFINDYHFIYNFGDDNLYAYTFREGLLKNEAAFDDEALVKKLAYTIDKRIVAYTYRKELVRNSSKIKDVRNCIEQIDTAIGKAYLSLGYINMRRQKLKAIKYFIKSLSIRYNKYAMVLLGKLVFPIGFKRVFFDTRELRL